MRALRQAASELMVRVHRIAPGLASYYVRQMHAAEIRRRMQIYTVEGLAGAELSVAGPNLVRATSFPPGFDDTATMTAGWRHSTLFPDESASKKPSPGMPDLEVKNRVRNPGRARSSTRRPQLSG